MFINVIIGLRESFRHTEKPRKRLHHGGVLDSIAFLGKQAAETRLSAFGDFLCNGGDGGGDYYRGVVEVFE